MVGKIIGFGLVNFLARFLLGGFLFLGITMNPQSFVYGFSLTVAALVVAYLLLRFVIRPRSVTMALGIGFVWVVIALVLDLAVAKPIVGVDPLYLLSEIQTWTRLAAIVVVAPFTVTAR